MESPHGRVRWGIVAPFSGAEDVTDRNSLSHHPPRGFVNKIEKQIKRSRAASRRVCEAPAPDGSMQFWRMHQLWELAEGLR